MKKVWYGLVLLLIFTACRKTKHDLPAGPQNPGPASAAATNVGTPTGAVVQKTIGTGGGSITSSDGKITLTIPAGALDADQNISVQPIENKMPLGIKNRSYRFLPHGLQFKKPATLTLAYDDNDIAGSASEQVGLATQTNKGNWKKIGQTQVNLNNRTVSTCIHHFSDYAFYESFKLVDEKTESDTALVKLRPSEEVKLTVYYVQEVELENDRFISVPVLASAYVKEWTVNGMVNVPDLTFGGLAGKNNYTLAERDYIAPRLAPNPNSITVTVKLDLGSKGVLFLLRNISILDVNSLNLNGKQYDNAMPSAIFLNNATMLNFGINKSFPNGKSAAVGVDIQDIASAVPGIYSYAASDKVKIVTHDELGHAWTSWKTNPQTGITQYSGNVNVTVSGSGPSRQLFIKVTGTLFGSSGTVGTAGVNTVLDVNAPVF
jgi:hypothetical protein